MPVKEGSTKAQGTTDRRTFSVDITPGSMGPASIPNSANFWGQPALASVGRAGAGNGPSSKGGSSRSKKVAVPNLAVRTSRFPHVCGGSAV